MPTLAFELTLAASLDELWAFHLDVGRALPLLSSPGSDVRIISADLPARKGQQVKMNVRGPLGKRLNWVAHIIEFEPPAGEANFRQARFVDVQASGPFASWRHEHHMAETGPGTSRLTDIIIYRAPFGPLGLLADWLFVRRQLESMFRHRHAVTRQSLE